MQHLKLFRALPTCRRQNYTKSAAEGRPKRTLHEPTSSAAKTNTPQRFGFDSEEMQPICCQPGEIYKKIDDLTF